MKKELQDLVSSYYHANLCDRCLEEFKKTWRTFDNVKGEVVIPSYLHCHHKREDLESREDHEVAGIER